jgi:hypothetical protein
VIKLDIETQLSSDFLRMLKQLEEPIDRQTALDMGKAARDAMLKTIAEGVSPVQGFGKFPSYKRPERYPGKRKAHSPVNLRLNGDFLESLTFDAVGGGSGGYTTHLFYENDQSKKEEGHALGVNGQPKRPTLPVKQGQTFTRQILDEINSVVNDRLNKITNG